MKLSGLIERICFKIKIYIEAFSKSGLGYTGCFGIKSDFWEVLKEFFFFKWIYNLLPSHDLNVDGRNAY